MHQAVVTYHYKLGTTITKLRGCFLFIIFLVQICFL